MTTDDDPLDLRLLAACAVAREAGCLAHAYFRDRGRLEIERKGPQDLVSRADREVEELIRKRLGVAFPGDAFLGEEGGGEGAERLWVIDPIDGTGNFLRGVPYWSVVIAYAVAGRTEIGVTYDPVHNELFAARRGQGATRDGRPIRVSGREPGAAAMGMSYTFKLDHERYLRLLEGCFRHGIDHRRLGSTALMLCHVADGRLDAMAALHCSYWDAVAGLLLVREAGGASTDFLAGIAAPTEPNRVFACTPTLRPILEELVGIGAATA